MEGRGKRREKKTRPCNRALIGGREGGGKKPPSLSPKIRRKKVTYFKGLVGEEQHPPLLPMYR